MNTSTPAVAAVRIGDEERRRAVEALGEHWAAGRLSADEFDERTSQALSARTAPELAVVFRELPSAQSDRSRPMSRVAASERRRLVLAATSSAALAGLAGLVVGLGADSYHAHAVVRHLLQLLPN